MDAVASFVGEDHGEENSKIRAALIVTGPNISSQGLLFEQLAEDLGDTVKGIFVRLRSAEAPNLKATLRKIIRDATQRSSEHTGDDAELSVGKDVSQRQTIGWLEKVTDGISWYRVANISIMTWRRCMRTSNTMRQNKSLLLFRTVRRLIPASCLT